MVLWFEVARNYVVPSSQVPGVGSVAPAFSLVLTRWVSLVL